MTKRARPPKLNIYTGCLAIAGGALLGTAAAPAAAMVPVALWAAGVLKSSGRGGATKGFSIPQKRRI